MLIGQLYYSLHCFAKHRIWNPIDACVHNAWMILERPLNFNRIDIFSANNVFIEAPEHTGRGMCAIMISTPVQSYQ